MKRPMMSVLFLAMVVASVSAFAQPVARNVPLEDFFRHAEFTSVTLSPDGLHMAVTVPVEDKTVLAMIRIADMQVVGRWDQGRNKHIQNIWWVNSTRFVYRVTEKTGTFDFRVMPMDMFVSDIDGRRHFAIPNGNTYQIIGRVNNEPDAIWVQRSREQAFLFKLDTSRGATRAGTRPIDPVAYAIAPLRGGSFLMDHDDQLRYAVGVTEDRRFHTLRRVGDGWELIHEGHLDEAMGRRTPMRFDADNRLVYFQVSDGGETTRTVLRNPETGEETLVSHNELVDPSGFVWSSDEKTLLAVMYVPDRPVYDIVSDHPEANVLRSLTNAFPDRMVTISDISEDQRYVLFRVFSDVDPGGFYLYDLQEGTARYLLSNRRWIDPDLMSPMMPISYEARDGMKIHGYLTLPKGTDGRDLPMVVYVHGGPHGPRDVWGFDRDVQVMASRGYAVLQLNFRGSGGYGADFMAAGYRKWGTAMQDDLTDGVRWAIEQGYAAENRICIYGGSYGGYAALMSPVREPDLYRCTIGYVGVYSLPLMFKDGDIPRSASGRAYQARILPETEAEQKAQSPAYNLDTLRAAVMLVHGAQDQRVPISQMNYLVRKMREQGIAPEDTVVERREGHGFYDVDNNVNLYTRIFRFLDRHTAPN